MAKFIVVHSVKVATEFVPETFGRLTTIGPKFMLSDAAGRHYARQVCRCACGDLGIYRPADLKTANTNSCGCYRKENSRSLLLIHGGSAAKTPEYTVWRKMRERCNSKGCRAYVNYGGRGILVCSEWDDLRTGYSQFISDMGPRPSPEHEIERKDVNAGYCADNCKWVTRSEQARNKRNTRYETAFGRTQCLAVWAEEYNVKYKALHCRLQRGWTLEKALTVPLKGQAKPT